MQVENPNPRSKAEDVIKKCEQLFTSKKYYEYSQKIKLFAHRKLQGKKIQQALYILEIAAIKLLSVAEDKEGQQLVNQWLKSLEQNKEVYSQDLFNSFLEIYNIKPSNERAGQFQRLIKLFRDKLTVPNKKLINEYLVEEYLRKGLYAGAEKYALFQTQSQGEAFLKKWSSKLTEQEGQFIKLRFGLLKIIYGGEEQGESILSQLKKDSPFRRLSDLLLQCFKKGSKQGFEKIGTCYASFLKQPSMQRIYQSLGYGVFGIRPNGPNNGLLSMFQ